MVKKKKTCEYEYIPCDRIVVFNDNDPNLTQVNIDQLDVIQRTFKFYGLKPPDTFPEFEYVDGYGLPPEQQMFQREKRHDGVVSLELKVRKAIKKELSPMRRELTVINAFWDEIDQHPEKYKDVIDFIKLQWYYRLFGKFFFNNGKVTYITGSYWDFLNSWTIQGDRPDYRDRDRRWQLAVKYTELDTTTFVHRDKDGKAIPESDGTYKMIDMGQRVWFGMVNTKVRRAGDSSKSAHNNTEYTSRMLEQSFGVQGKDDDNAREMFTEHIVAPLNNENYPIYFKPLRKPSENISPQNEMSFKNEENYEVGSLKSKINYATSADALKFDMARVDRFLIDEAGKTSSCDIIKRHGVIKYCLSHGSEIRGHALYPTTCDTIEDRSAGERFMNMCYDSLWDKRDDNGQTGTGLCLFHFRATDGLHPYIDQYGISKEDEARRYIDGKIAYLKKNKKFQDLADFKRQHPILFKDNFSIALKNQFFNKDILETREQYLNFDAPEQRPRRGMFQRKSADGDVVFIDDPEGISYLSVDMEELARKYGARYKPNQRVKENGVWMPVNCLYFVASGDPFAQDKTQGRASDGGGAIKWMLDKEIDPDAKDLADRISCRPAWTCSYRPDTVAEYSQQMIMACQYFNAMIYPENNVKNLINDFVTAGYGGYLLHDIDATKMKQAQYPGWWHGGSGNGKALMAFNLMRDDIQKNGKRWTHTDLIIECLSIIDPKDMTNWDLFTSYCGCLIAEQNPFYDMMRESFDNKLDTSEWMNQYV